MQFGVHHYAHRKRLTKGKRDAGWLHAINGAAYFAGILGPLFTIDQVEKVWIQQDVSGVSLITWSANCLFSIVWVIYGIAHKERAIIITNALWVLLNGLVALGAFLYA